MNSNDDVFLLTHKIEGTQLLTTEENIKKLFKCGGENFWKKEFVCKVWQALGENFGKA